MVYLLLVLLLFPLSVAAQSTSELFQSQNSKGGEYRAAYSAFQLAKNQHIQYNTGTTRLTAISKTNDVLSKRNVWQIDYLKYLRSALADTTNIANYAQTVVYLDLENEITNLQNMSSDLTSGTSFEEINTTSETWEKRLETSQRLIDASILQIASSRLEKMHTELEELVNKYKAENPELTPEMETTLNLITQKITTAQTARTSVNSAISSYKSSFWTKNTQFTQLKSAKTYLIEAAQLLAELERQ